MKRRSFLQGLLAAIPLLPAKTLYADIAKEGVTQRSMKIPMSPKARWFSLKNTPERATKYISGLYRNKAWITEPEGVKITSLNIKGKEFDHYVISGEGTTKEEAWDKFWMDFEEKTILTVTSYPPHQKDIFWRRVVVQTHVEKSHMNRPDSWKVDCRFSLGDFT